MERVEINEAFAVVPPAMAQGLDLPLEIVNIEGRVVAHGRRISTAGAMLATRLLHAMPRDVIRRGIVTLCIGGGQGIAVRSRRPARRWRWRRP